MSNRRTYALLIFLCIVAFLYIVSTEVIERWDTTLANYEEVLEKEKTVVEPSELAAKKTLLREQKQTLRSLLTTTAMKTFGQDHAGLVKLFNESAQTSGIKIESLSPKEPRIVGKKRIIEFALDVTGSYHQLGIFLNTLEAEPLPIEIKGATLATKQAGSARLQAKIEGSVQFMKGVEN